MNKHNLLIKLIISFFPVFISISIYSQIDISGRVTDIDDEPLPGVNIIEKGTNQGTITDINGNYSITVNSDDAVLRFSFVGYLTEEIEVGQKTTIDVTLVADIQALDEVVVVGYGVQKKSDITGAVASIDKDRIEETPQSNIGQVLQGAIPGLSITQSSSGADPSNQRILLRGESSISASNTPLIIVDGIPINGDQTSDNSPLFILSDFNQQDIESIEVLKDATSAAIYGARAANGVVLITTKKGSKGKPKIGYDAYAGIENIANKPNLMNAQEFFNYRVERIDSSIITATEIENLKKGVNTDWVDVALRQGFTQNHVLRAEGGSESFNYYISGGYQSTEGIAKNDKYDKYTLRTNLEQKLGEWLTIGTNTQFTNVDKTGAAADFGSDRGAFYFNPMIEPYDLAGNIEIYPWPEQGFFRNPLVPLNYIQSNINRRLFTNNFLEITIPGIKGLSYKLNTGYIFSTWNFNEYRGRNTADGLALDGFSNNSSSTNTDLLIENIFKYNRSFGKHSVDLTGLYSWQKIINEYRDQDAQGFISDELTYYQTDVALQIFGDASYRKQTYLSQMLRLNYSFDSKYLFTVTVRRDGYSAFGEDRKFGVFPSAAIGWNMHNENFMNMIEPISMLKLRLSYGLNGNQAVPSYSTLARNNSIGFWSADEGAAYGYYPQFLGNEELGWESSRSINIGLDYGLFQNRINGSLEIYNTNTSDLLLYRSISYLHGFEPTVLTNIGKTKNQGIEFAVNMVPLQTSDFTWSLNLNMSHNRNEIVELYGNGEDDIGNQWFIGQPINVNYGYKFDGIFQQEDDIENSPLPDAEPGYAKIADTNQDSMITADDRIILSDQQPDLIGGISNSFSYKNWQLSFFLHFVQGVTKANPFKDWGRTWGEAQRNTVKLDYWSPENPINDYPVNDPNALSGYYVRFYENASFLRMKDATLSYNLPESLLNRINIQRMRIYGSVSNLFTITKWSGLDPELDGQSSIPLTRKYIIGLNITL